jgi:hypothetical protein
MAGARAEPALSVHAILLRTRNFALIEQQISTAVVSLLRRPFLVRTFNRHQLQPLTLERNGRTVFPVFTSVEKASRFRRASARQTIMNWNQWTIGHVPLKELVECIQLSSVGLVTINPNSLVGPDSAIVPAHVFIALVGMERIE